MRIFLPKSLDSRLSQVHVNFFWRTLSVTKTHPPTNNVIRTYTAVVYNRSKKLNHVFVKWVNRNVFVSCCLDICKKSGLSRYFRFGLIYPTVYKQDQSRHQPHIKPPIFVKFGYIFAISNWESHIVSVSLIRDNTSSGSDWKSDSWRELSI